MIFHRETKLRTKHDGDTREGRMTTSRGCQRKAHDEGVIDIRRCCRWRELCAGVIRGRRHSETSSGFWTSASWAPMSSVFVLKIIAALFVLIISSREANALLDDDDVSCCNLASSDCRAVCHKLPLWKLAGDERQAQIDSLRAVCGPDLEKFWGCFNNTLLDISEGVGWSGRPCCRLALSPSCQATCLQARDAPQLTPSCRASHEIDFFECVQRTEEGAACCARTQSYRCRASCEAVFAARNPSRRLRHRLIKDCRTHAHVTRCAHSLIRTTPAHRPERNLHCCAASDIASCRTACRAVLTSGASQQDILEKLEDVCGTVDLTNGVWKCIFRHSDGAAPEVRQVSKLGRLGLDAAKLGCCNRAVSAECQGLCNRAFSKEWGRAWETLQSSCLTRPQESSLFACLAEADAPCQQGCSGLSFCTNFNHRPNDLFRSCNSRADAAAEEDLQLWQGSRTLTLPGLASPIPLRSVDQCQGELWRAVACSLHLRPCHPTSLTNAICWHDCVKLLSRCVDDSRSTEGGITATTVCGTLSPPPGSPCVSLTPFLSPSPVPNEPPWRIPTLPCRTMPCPGRHVCSVNNECRAAEPCRPYTCTPACTLGEVSNVAVPVGAFVSVPFSSGFERCGRVCECGSRGELEDCRPLPCVDPAPCWLGTSKFDHNTELSIGCDLCVCHAGELTCVPRSTCPQHLHRFLPANTGIGSGAVSSSLHRSAGSSDLPCGCADHWVPVCAANGRTFPSECLARCAGLDEESWVAGDCGLLDACAGVRCGRGEVCVAAPAMCLTLPTTSCPQHICVPTSGPCPAEASSPACDNQGINFNSLCQLVRSGSNLAYLGRCRTRCSTNGTICGRDGRTWPNECHAHAHFVAVDYSGPCRGVGVDGSSCPSVTCPSTPDPRCVGVESNGWCCGRLCGGGLMVAWSSRAVEVAAVALPHHRPLTVTALLSSLAAHITVSECEIRGHLTLEGHVLVVVTPTATHTPSPPPLVSAACVVEAERLVGVIRARSPALVAALPAAAITLAAPAHTSSAPAVFRPLPTQGVILLMVLAVLVPKYVVEVALL